MEGAEGAESNEQPVTEEQGTTEQAKLNKEQAVNSEQGTSDGPVAAEKEPQGSGLASGYASQPAPTAPTEQREEVDEAVPKEDNAAQGPSSTSSGDQCSKGTTEGKAVGGGLSKVLPGAVARVATALTSDALRITRYLVGKAGEYIAAKVVDSINSQAEFVKMLWLRPVVRSDNPNDKEAIVVLALTVPEVEQQVRLLFAMQAVIINPLVESKQVSEFKIVNDPPAHFTAPAGALLLLELAVEVPCPITFTDLKRWKKQLGSNVEIQVVPPPGTPEKPILNPDGAWGNWAADVSGDTSKDGKEPRNEKAGQRGDLSWKEVFWPF